MAIVLIKFCFSRYSLSDANRGYPSFHRQEAAVALFGLPIVSLSDEMKLWVSKAHDEMLMSIDSKSWKSLDDRDGIHLVSMAQEFYGFDYIKDRCVANRRTFCFEKSTNLILESSLSWRKNQGHDVCRGIFI